MCDLSDAISKNERGFINIYFFDVSMTLQGGWNILRSIYIGFILIKCLFFIRKKQ